MIRKNLLLTTFVLAALAFSSIAVLGSFAWNYNGSYTCIANGNGPATCSSGQGTVTVSAGKVSDTAYIADADTSWCDGTCPSVTGTVVFYLYSSSNCQGTAVANSGPISNTGTYPGVYTYAFSSVSSSGSVRALYTGNYAPGNPDGVWLTCEPFSVTTRGVPEFPFASFGLFALIGIMIPMLYLMRAKFANKLALQ